MNITIDGIEKLAKEYQTKADSLFSVARILRLNGFAEHEGRGLHKGYKFKPGTHWMQQPKNKSKLMKVVRKMQRARMLKRVGESND